MSFLRRHVMLLALSLTTVMLLPFAGPWLEKSDKIDKSDAILMLMGSVADRALQVSDLYNSRKADYVFVVEESNIGFALLKLRGVQARSTTDLVLSILSQLGIPDNNLSVVSGQASSTIMEAKLFANQLRKIYPNRKTPFKLIIVSSPSHMRRASMVFRRALRNLPFPVDVIACPSSYSPSITYDWFLHREQIQDVLYEYVKLSAWILIERWKL